MFVSHRNGRMQQSQAQPTRKHVDKVAIFIKNLWLKLQCGSCGVCGVTVYSIKILMDV
jgi:ribosomal protein L44E